MGRRLRSPAVLMTLYVAVYVVSGPWLGSGSTTDHRNVPQIVLAVLLAVLAARGSRTARVLMITYTVLGGLAVFFGSTHAGTSELTVFLALTSVLVQIGLLVSAPMYQRTRPGWSPGRAQAVPLLPWPKWGVVLAGAVGGLALALVPFSDGIRPTILCSAGGGMSAQPCGLLGFGYPIAYRFASYNLAPRGVDVAAFAADWALWAMSIFLVLYLLQVSRGRPDSDLGTGSTVQNLPAAQ